jgi:hypothetical protein
MLHGIGSIALGALVVGGASTISWRRPLRVVVREGVRAQRKLAQVGASIRAEAQQLVAEAREELDRPSGAASASKG